MIERRLIHVAGPARAGKTTLIERLLGSSATFVISVRAERDAKLRREAESAPRNDAELRRYRDAGASAVTRYRFGQPDTDAFYTSDVMQDYSEAVFIEGDCPVDFVDLSVFVAPPPPRGESLLECVLRDRAAAHNAAIERFEQALGSSEAAARLLGTGIGEGFLERALTEPQILEDIRHSMAAKLDDLRRAPPPPPTRHWVLARGYAGIERAQLVVVNVRSVAERERAEPLLAEITRLREDEEVYGDVIGLGGTRLPITAVLADLANPKDAGVKKALARVKRAIKRRQS